MKHWHIGIKFANDFGAPSIKSKLMGNINVKEELHNRAQKKKHSRNNKQSKMWVSTSERSWGWTTCLQSLEISGAASF